MKKNLTLFYCSIFFVLGFSLVFSLFGVLLQTLLARFAASIQQWFSKMAGAFIIFFGLYLLGLIPIAFLEKEHKIHIKKKFSSRYITSFLFGASFALGWTPCVGPVLGAVLTLAVNAPTHAFLLLFSYSLGLGIPFLILGFFSDQAKKLIRKNGKYLLYFRYTFGAILIILGILLFVNQIHLLANFSFLSEQLTSLQFSGVLSHPSLNIIVAFFAGLVSFLSPCVLPLMPAFLSYLATLAIDDA